MYRYQRYVYKLMNGGMACVGGVVAVTSRTGFYADNSCLPPASVLFHPLKVHRMCLETRERVPSKNQDRIGGSYWCVVSNSGSS